MRKKTQLSICIFIWITTESPLFPRPTKENINKRAKAVILEWRGRWRVRITCDGGVENGIEGGYREERWMRADYRHYTPPAVVFVWIQSAVTVMRAHRRHTNTYTYIDSPKKLWLLTFLISQCFGKQIQVNKERGNWAVGDEEEIRTVTKGTKQQATDNETHEGVERLKTTKSTEIRQDWERQRECG